MQKRIIETRREDSATHDQQWLSTQVIQTAEITSEDADHPIESALLPEGGAGWRAAAPGRQTIRLVFAQPQTLRRIWLHFVEPSAERTQEYTLRWSGDGGKSFSEVVRQQWNFSPRGASSETEDHRVDLPAVGVLELSIVPDIGGGDAVASLAQLRLA